MCHGTNSERAQRRRALPESASAAGFGVIFATALAYGASCSASEPGTAVAAVPDSSVDATDSNAETGSDAHADAVAPDAASSPWIVSPETAPVSQVEQDEPGLERHLDPAVGVGSSTVLVAWSDERSDPLNQFAGDIMLARYTAEGTALDPKGIRLAVTADQERSPRIAFGKGLFLVAWWAITRAPNGAGGDGLVRAARVAPDGSVLDPQGLDLGKNAGPPEVAFVDDRFLVAFEANERGRRGSVARAGCPSQVRIAVSMLTRF